ncbi:hypothetical protein PT974_11987 [Cladobotryum mycophilum]|uniref:Protein kinase domain-containing protein n=1 Tax=Cladobotryum mycophilum TaxID=491253 RepID=A0ABR0S6W3_9HYPO
MAALPLGPTEILGVETAVLENGTALLGLVGCLVRKAREVVYFRRECLELANMSIALAATYNEVSGDGRLEDVLLANKFNHCLDDVNLFIVQCLKANAVHVTWEVVVQQKLAGLRGRLANAQKALDTELLTTESLLALRVDVADVRDAVQDTGTERAQFLDRIRALETDLRRSHEERRLLQQAEHNRARSYSPDVIVLPHSDVIVKTWENYVQGMAIPATGVYLGTPVVFELIHHSNFDKVPLEHGGSRLAMMESMESHVPLAVAISDGTFDNAGPARVLRFVYELAATVSALHVAGLLIKVLSDESVFVERLADGSIRPRLSQLHQARAIWEVSTLTEQDIRFDAPETAAAGTRSKILGVLIFEIFIRKLPYGCRAADLGDPSRHPAAASKPQRRDSAIHRIFSHQLDTSDVVAPKLALECLRSEPFLRPTSSSLAQQLLDELIMAAAAVSAPVSEDSGARDTINGHDKHLNDNFGNTSLGIANIPEPRWLFDVVRGIISAPRALPKEENTTASTSSGTTLDHRTTCIGEDEFRLLTQMADDGDPTFAYAVGLAYMKGLTDFRLEEGTVTQSNEVQRAKLAIVYLDKAEQRGHDGAAKELLRAYKLLAKHYHGLLSRPEDF